MTIAYWCILIAGLLPQMTGLYAKLAKDYDNNNPRIYLSKLEGKRARAVAAMKNGFEGLPLFIAAVIIAHLAHVTQNIIDGLAISYLIIRVIYSVVYIQGLGGLRSVVWSIGLLCIISLFVFAQIA